MSRFSIRTLCAFKTKKRYLSLQVGDLVSQGVPFDPISLSPSFFLLTEVIRLQHARVGSESYIQPPYLRRAFDFCDVPVRLEVARLASLSERAVGPDHGDFVKTGRNDDYLGWQIEMKDEPTSAPFLPAPLPDGPPAIGERALRVLISADCCSTSSRRRDRYMAIVFRTTK